MKRTGSIKLLFFCILWLLSLSLGGAVYKYKYWKVWEVAYKNWKNVPAPPISAPPISAPPISAPPISAPPISAPPISVPPIHVPPIPPQNWTIEFGRSEDRIPESKPALRAIYEQSLKEASSILDNEPNSVLEIRASSGGQSDTTLADARAKNIHDDLVRFGVSADQLRMGQPIVSSERTVSLSMLAGDRGPENASKPIRSWTIEFGRGEDRIPESKPALRAIYEQSLKEVSSILGRRPNSVLEIRASSKSKSDTTLADARARNIHDDLVRFGVSADQLRIGQPIESEERTVSLILRRSAS